MRPLQETCGLLLLCVAVCSLPVNCALQLGHPRRDQSFNTNCKQYQQPTTCYQHSECQWVNNAACQLKPCVLRHYTQAGCDADMTCFWNTTNSICLPFSAAKYCAIAYKTELSCNANPKCVWSDTKTLCEPIPCASISSQSECNSTVTGRCYWDKSKASCGNFQYSDCDKIESQNQCYNYSPTCAWYSNAGCMAQPCQLLYTSESTCNAHTRCAWYPTAKQCRSFSARTNCSMEYKTESTCTGNPKCIWNGDKCEAIPCNQLRTQGSCNATSRCFWSESTNTCQDFKYTDCEKVKSQNYCYDFSPVCAWYLNAGCMAQPCQLLYTAEAECNAHTRCAWYPTAKQCRSFSARTNCSIEYKTQTACSANPKCSWNPSQSQCEAIPCQQFPTQNTCNATTRCLWSSPSDTCKNFHYTDCVKMKSQTQCFNYSPTCAWYSNAGCMAQPCQLLYKSQSTCNDHPDRCTWNSRSGQCEKK